MYRAFIFAFVANGNVFCGDVCNHGPRNIIIRSYVLGNNTGRSFNTGQRRGLELILSICRNISGRSSCCRSTAKSTEVKHFASIGKVAFPNRMVNYAVKAL